TTESLPVPPPGAATTAPTPEPVPTQADAEETQPEQRAAEPVVAEPQNAEPAESIVVAVAEPAAEEPQTTFSLPGSTGRLEARAPSQPRQQPSPVQPLPSLSGLRAPEPPASEPEPAEDIEVAAVTPQASARTSAARRPETTPRADLVIDYGNQNAASVQPRIRVLTGEFAPYTGRTLPESGMLADIMVEAIAASAPGRGLRMTFADEWEAHLDTLLPESRYDIGFPWFRPNCDAPERLSAEMRRRCSDFVWSQPLHEVVVGVFVRAGDPLTRVSEYAALSGRSLCRPEGFQTLDLFQKGVVPASVRRVEAVDAKACMRQLVAGQVDAVALDIVKAEGVLGELGLFNAVAEAPALADIITLHAIAPRSNPFGRTYVTLLDRGLRDLRDSGAWFDIVARHLAGQF
ncbi:MAG: transporter substrate-binding domain-containing protein, partial [Pseudomonadota bacterium]